MKLEPKGPSVQYAVYAPRAETGLHTSFLSVCENGEWVQERAAWLNDVNQTDVFEAVQRVGNAWRSLIDGRICI